MKRQDAVIHSVPARAMVNFLKAPKETASVQDAEAARAALLDPDNVHVCPLCFEPFKSEDFKLHAPECIKLRAVKIERQRDKPITDSWKERRRRLWLPIR